MQPLCEASTKSSPKMIDCGLGDWHVNLALSYLPTDVFAALDGKITIVSTTRSDGFRMAKKIRENCDIIVLSERLFPRGMVTEDHPDVRYLIFVVLHEIAHAFKNHRSPVLDGLSAEESAAQEAEADHLAYHWFNDHVRRRNNDHLRELAVDEVTQAQKKNQELMKAAFA